MTLALSPAEPFEIIATLRRMNDNVVRRAKERAGSTYPEKNSGMVGRTKGALAISVRRSVKIRTLLDGLNYVPNGSLRTATVACRATCSPKKGSKIGIMTSQS